MSPFDGVIPVRELAAPVLIEPSSDPAGRKLSSVRVAREHPLPRISQKLLCIDRIVIQTDHRKIAIDASKTFLRIDVSGPFIVQTNQHDRLARAVAPDGNPFIPQHDQPASLETI